MEKAAVVITTKNRGVFFGYLADDSEAPKKVTLSDARMCVYWDEKTKGVLGLGAKGPTSGCRITDSIPELTVWDVTGQISCTEEATKAWEKAPWR